MTSVIGKILEAIIADSIREHLDRHNLIHESQHGLKESRASLIFYPFTIRYTSQLTMMRVTM